MIDPKLFTVEGLLTAMLKESAFDDRNWRMFAEIIPDYMPPYPRPDTRPTCVVKMGGSFLRYSHGPVQGYFWDVYGDNFDKPEWALLALLHAPVPPFFMKRMQDAMKDSESFGCVTFKLPKRG